MTVINLFKTMDNSQSINLQLKAGDIQITDPKEVLKECIIFFAFPKSRSANFPIALSLAQAATAYGEQDVSGRTLYWAGFTKSISDLEKAAELLRLAGSWVGTMAKVSGCKVTKPFNAYLTISCYLEGLQCSNQAAHCHKLIDDPFHPDYDVMSETVKQKAPLRSCNSDTIQFDEKIKRYSFPCKRMLEFSMFHPTFRFNDVHQIEPQDQIQAAAVEYGISACPFFEVTAFAEVGFRCVETEEVITSQLTLSDKP
ncbi:MAG: hypothetical protein V2B20_24105 [Pseudomonadota bacterium]